MLNVFSMPNDSEKISKKDASTESFTLRSEEISDREFLESLYISVRFQEFASVGWSAAQINDFLKMQFDMQSRAYRMQFPEAVFSIVELNGERIGRLIVNRGEKEFRLVDISIKGAYRNRGIGSFFLKKLQSEAALAEKPLMLKVLKTNEAAFRLYERCGFKIVDASGLYNIMRWQNS